jgi:hypothetical protein
VPEATNATPNVSPRFLFLHFGRARLSTPNCVIFPAHDYHRIIDTALVFQENVFVTPVKFVKKWFIFANAHDKPQVDLW